MGPDAEREGPERTATGHQDGDATVPARGRPAMVLVTFRVPGVARYTLITFTGTTLPAGTVTVRLIADHVHLTSAVAPSAVSVTVHTEPAGIPSKLCDTLPARVLAGITKSGDRAVPLQATWMVTGPWRPASGPAMVLLTSREPLDAGSMPDAAPTRRGVAVADVHLDDLTGRDGRGLPAPVDDDRHRAGVPVSGLRDGALRRGWM